MDLYPIISILRLYFPGGILMRVNRPLSSEADPNEVFSRYTFAPGNGAESDLSLIKPEILPVV